MISILRIPFHVDHPGMVHFTAILLRCCLLVTCSTFRHLRLPGKHWFLTMFCYHLPDPCHESAIGMLSALCKLHHFLPVIFIFLCSIIHKFNLLVQKKKSICKSCMNLYYNIIVSSSVMLCTISLIFCSCSPWTWS